MTSADPPRLWLRLEREASSCPACDSSRISLLEAFKIPRVARGRRVAFLTACRECGLVFANPLPTAAELQSHYSAEEGTYAAARKRIATKQAASANPAPVRDERELLFAALAPYMPGSGRGTSRRALDFGCGDGKYLDWLQEAGWDTCGIELSTDRAFARHRRLEAIPADGSFDFAMLHHVLEHVTRPLDLLRQIAGALRPGGLLFVSVPRLDTLAEHGDFKYCVDGRNHVVAFTAACLQGLLIRAGYGAVMTLDGDLDEALTAGQPLRLRLVATRVDGETVVTGTAFRSAMEALGGYWRARDGIHGVWRRAVPVRIRAAMMDRAIERRARERRRAKT